MAAFHERGRREERGKQRGQSEAAEVSTSETAQRIERRRGLRGVCPVWPTCRSRTERRTPHVGVGYRLPIASVPAGVLLRDPTADIA
jgi:hypothetical protein